MSILYIKHLGGAEKAAVDIAVYNMNRSDTLMKDINQILRILGDGGYQFNKEKETFDLVELITDTLRHFKGSLVKKNLSFKLDMPGVFDVYLNRVSTQLLLHNVISNMVQYALKDSSLEIEIIDDGDYFSLISRNRSSKENIERMKNSEELFNVVDKASDEEHSYSSGNGLFLIKDLVHFLDGEYRYQSEGEEVILSLRIPVGGEK